ncbi:MAG: hypothetical protein AAF490_01020 [Chloroflexota bacterium]
MKKITALILIFFTAILAACGAQAGAESSAAENTLNNEVAAASVLEGDLPQDAQLAVGSLLLEETDQAISEEQAQTLLPLWQAYETLSATGTAADVELDALVSQIEGEMSTEQVASIQEMDLNQESIQALLQDGTLRFGGFGGGDGEGGGQFGGGPAGGGGGGGQLGGGPPGGGGGQGGGGVQGLDPATVQTRQAERAANGGGAGIGRFTTTAVIRLLEGKTGVAQPNQQQEAGFSLTQTLSEALGLSVQELRGALEDGQTLGEFAEANGDLDSIRASLIESLADTELPEGQTAAEAVDAFLSQGLQNRGGQRGNGNGGG